MADLFNITHEVGDLSEYDATVVDGGDLSAHADAALADTGIGLKCVIDDTNSIYGQKNQAAPGSNEIRFRFYVDPNALTMANADRFNILELRSTGPQNFIYRAMLRYTIAGGYFIRDDPWGDGGAAGATDVAISDAPHYIEVYIVRATDDDDADGTAEMWIDGVSEASTANIDNWDVFGNMSLLKMGAPGGIDAGTHDTFYLDELRANDDGAEIGPVGQPMMLRATTVPHMRQWQPGAFR